MRRLGVQSSVAVVYGLKAGLGGLGVQSANALAGLATGNAPVHAFGPGRVREWPLPGEVPAVNWHESPVFVPPWAARYTWLRWRTGRLQFQHNRRLGSWAAVQVERLQPEHCYVFTQVGLETLKWARRAGIPTVLESPNGHIRDFRAVYETESLRWCGMRYWGHPSLAMLERVEEEYHLADRIRVSSEWAKASIAARGVPANKIYVFQQPLNLLRFYPRANNVASDGPLRVCYVGSLDLRKGFPYLLRAIRLMGADRVSLEIMGATGDRCCRRLFARERVGLRFKCHPGDPIPAYHAAEIFVLPTLEDGSPFAAAEAMACGLPVIVTENCGAAEWVRPGHTGWIVPAKNAEALAGALEDALRRRKDLAIMGQLARTDVERRAGPSCYMALCDWFYNGK